jgi:hypothetical protein
MSRRARRAGAGLQLRFSLLAFGTFCFLGSKQGSVVRV